MADERDETTGSPRGLSRRQALGLGAVAAGAVAAGSVLGSGAADAATPAAVQPPFPLSPDGTTLARTLLHGTPDANGYRKVVAGDGEASILRDELSGGLTRGKGRRRAVAAFAQFTDMHIVDAQSPARVEFLDRLNDPGSPFATIAPFDSAYRAQEMLSAQVAEAMVQAVNALAAGAPVSGRTLDFTVCTGDNSDNTQFNEVRWQIDLMDGRKPVRPDSGDLTKWEGVGGSDDLDVSYWHPDGTPPGGSEDNAHRLYGFHDVPGLLDHCRRAFRASGLATPWYSSFGNHDGLVQGTVPHAAAIEAIAVGSAKVTGLPVGVNLLDLFERFLNGDFTAFVELLSEGPAKVVTADANRRMLSRDQVVAEHFKTTGTPVGHGYNPRNLRDGTAYYSFTKGNVHYISLDTVNPNGYSDGSLDTAQLAWLTGQLNDNSSRHLDTDGNWVTGTGTDRLVVIFSHHTVESMGNLLGTDRVSGTTVADLLLQYPNVIAWVNGHTHINQVTAFARAAGAAAPGGFWQVNTAAHIDWPQQCRVVEVVDNGDGATLSIFGTIVDHAAPLRTADPRSPLQLASLSRELGINDWQRKPEDATTDGRRGEAQDRNVELLVPKPY